MPSWLMVEEMKDDREDALSLEEALACDPPPSPSDSGLIKVEISRARSQHSGTRSSASRRLAPPGPPLVCRRLHSAAQLAAFRRNAVLGVRARSQRLITDLPFSPLLTIVAQLKLKRTSPPTSSERLYETIFASPRWVFPEANEALVLELPTEYDQHTFGA